MSFFIASWDVVCPADVAMSYIEQIQAPTTIVEANYVEHFYFAKWANTDWFMENLLE